MLFFVPQAAAKTEARAPAPSARALRTQRPPGWSQRVLIFFEVGFTSRGGGRTSREREEGIGDPPGGWWDSVSGPKGWL